MADGQDPAQQAGAGKDAGTGKQDPGPENKAILEKLDKLFGEVQEIKKGSETLKAENQSLIKGLTDKLEALMPKKDAKSTAGDKGDQTQKVPVVLPDTGKKDDKKPRKSWFDRLLG